jgi:hypothetical protein
MLGFTGTESVTLAFTPLSTVEVAVSVTVKAVLTLRGAANVTEVLVALNSPPQTVALHPLSVQFTPAADAPPATVAVKFAESPGSIVSEAGPLRVIPVGTASVLLPPQPLSSGVKPSSKPSASWAARPAQDRDLLPHRRARRPERSKKGYMSH